MLPNFFKSVVNATKKSADEGETPSHILFRFDPHLLNLALASSAFILNDSNVNTYVPSES